MELTLETIQSKNDLLLKSYWLYVYSNLRTDVWENLFKEHLDKHYPVNPNYTLIKDKVDLVIGDYYQIPDGEFKGEYRAIANVTLNLNKITLGIKAGNITLNGLTILRNIGSARNNKRTNFPRALWQKDELTWYTYYEALCVLLPAYKEINLDFKLIYKDREIHTYTVPVDFNLLDIPEGENIRHKGKVSKTPVIRNELDRSYEAPLTYIIREVIRRHKLTRVDLDKLLDTFIDNPNNLANFSNENRANIKSSILGTMFKWNLGMGNFSRALTVLGYTELSLTIRAEMKAGRRVGEMVQTGVSMRLTS